MSTSTPAVSSVRTTSVCPCQLANDRAVHPNCRDGNDIIVNMRPLYCIHITMTTTPRLLLEDNDKGGTIPGWTRVTVTTNMWCAPPAARTRWYKERTSCGLGVCCYGRIVGSDIEVVRLKPFTQLCVSIYDFTRYIGLYVEYYLP